jgi:hypothetical protein
MNMNEAIDEAISLKDGGASWGLGGRGLHPYPNFPKIHPHPANYVRVHQYAHPPRHIKYQGQGTETLCLHMIPMDVALHSKWVLQHHSGLTLPQFS